MNEEIKDTSKAAPAAKSRSLSSYAKPFSINEISTEDEHRYDTGCKELNRVLGGGIVKGSLILLGGDPARLRRHLRRRGRRGDGPEKPGAGPSAAGKRAGIKGTPILTHGARGGRFFQGKTA